MYIKSRNFFSSFGVTEFVFISLVLFSSNAFSELSMVNGEYKDLYISKSHIYIKLVCDYNQSVLEKGGKDVLAVNRALKEKKTALNSKTIDNICELIQEVYWTKRQFSSNEITDARAIWRKSYSILKILAIQLGKKAADIEKDLANLRDEQEDYRSHSSNVNVNNRMSKDDSVGDSGATKKSEGVEQLLVDSLSWMIVDRAKAETIYSFQEEFREKVCEGYLSGYFARTCTLMDKRYTSFGLESMYDGFRVAVREDLRGFVEVILSVYYNDKAKRINITTSYDKKKTIIREDINHLLRLLIVKSINKITLEKIPLDAIVAESIKEIGIHNKESLPYVMLIRYSGFLMRNIKLHFNEASDQSLFPFISISSAFYFEQEILEDASHNTDVEYIEKLEISCGGSDYVCKNEKIVNLLLDVSQVAIFDLYKYEKYKRRVLLGNAEDQSATQIKVRLFRSSLAMFIEMINNVNRNLGKYLVPKYKENVLTDLFSSDIEETIKYADAILTGDKAGISYYTTHLIYTYFIVPGDGDTRQYYECDNFSLGLTYIWSAAKCMFNAPRHLAPKEKQISDRLVSILPIMADISNSKSSQEVGKIISNSMAPVGSYKIKKIRPVASISAYGGLNIGELDKAENYKKLGHELNSYSLFFPIGFHYSLPWKSKYSFLYKNVGVFVSLLDVGSNINIDSGSGLDVKGDVGFREIISPGFYLTALMYKNLTVGGGVSYSPSLYINDIEKTQESVKLGLFLALDLTLYPF